VSKRRLRRKKGKPFFRRFEDRKMRIALIGNPNCGKTTLFNKITGSKLPVGNRAGVTVTETEGTFGDDLLYDLPGIYSLTGSVNEETVAAAFLKNADYVINVVDANRLSRSLLLTSQLLERKIPMVVALNMTDGKSNANRRFDGDKLSKILGCPVVILKRTERDFNKLKTSSNVKNYRVFSGSAEEKFNLFDRIERQVVTGKPTDFSDKIDKILYNKYLAFPIFLIIMSAVLAISAGLFGTFLGKYVTIGIDALSEYIKRVGEGKINGFILSLLSDGILTGIGGVLGFAPLVVSLFFLLELLENCGYLSRVAVIFDSIFSRFGASGKSAVCLILGCGCTVPGVMSTRTLPNCERKKCIYNLHFIPCSAKLPVLSVLLSCCFENGFLLTPFFYIIGVFAVFISLFFAKKSDDPPFLMEIPPMKMPDLRQTLSATANKLRSFLVKVGTVVFAASVAVWFLQSYNFSFKPCAPEQSILYSFCNVFKYLFLPIGLADWRIFASFLAGFAGKETVIGVLSVVGNGDIPSVFTSFTAFQYALFLTLSPPCAASLSTMKKELGRKHFLKCLLRQFAISYAVCAVTNLAYLVTELLF